MYMYMYLVDIASSVRKYFRKGREREGGREGGGRGRVKEGEGEEREEEIDSLMLRKSINLQYHSLLMEPLSCVLHCLFL